MWEVLIMQGAIISKTGQDFAGYLPKHNGSPGRARTADPVINSHLLYLLSYRGIGRVWY